MDCRDMDPGPSFLVSSETNTTFFSPSSSHVRTGLYFFIDLVLDCRKDGLYWLAENCGWVSTMLAAASASLPTDVPVESPRSDVGLKKEETAGPVGAD